MLPVASPSTVVFPSADLESISWHISSANAFEAASGDGNRRHDGRLGMMRTGFGKLKTCVVWNQPELNLWKKSQPFRPTGFFEL